MCYTDSIYQDALPTCRTEQSNRNQFCRLCRADWFPPGPRQQRDGKLRHAPALSLRPMQQGTSWPWRHDTTLGHSYNRLHVKIRSPVSLQQPFERIFHRSQCPWPWKPGFTDLPACKGSNGGSRIFRSCSGRHAMVSTLGPGLDTRAALLEPLRPS